jgi:hypothetical protein
MALRNSLMGSFNNYVDRILLLIDPPPPPAPHLHGQFLYPEGGQKQTYQYFCGLFGMPKIGCLVIAAIMGFYHFAEIYI